MALDNDTLEQLLDVIRRFVRERLVPNELRVSEKDQIPEDILNDMKDLGLFGLTIPEEYGGLGLSMEEEVKVLFEICQTSPVYRSAFGTNVGIGSQGIVIDGTEEQKKHYLPKLASGEMISCFALTEPDIGSDASSLKTSARREGDDYIINGTKRYITNAPEAGIITLMARTNPESTSGRGVSAFIVETNTPGITLGKADRKMGQQGAHTCDIIFDECRVPASAIIGGVEGMGFKTAMKVLNKGRIHIAAVCVGMAERSLRDGLTFAMERKQFGKRIADFQLIQAMIADSKAEVFAARSMVLESARARDNGMDVSTEASCCKMFASEMLCRVVDRTVQIHGGAGYMTDYAAERFYRDARLFRIYEGTTQIQQISIARNLVRDAELNGNI